MVINNANGSLSKAFLWNKAPGDLAELLADALSQSIETDADLFADHSRVEAPWR